MIRKIIFKKYISVLLCIIIVGYLGYLLLNSSLNNIEGYKKNNCSGSDECQSGNCFNAGNAGQSSFCAPADFSLDKFRAQPNYIGDDTKITNLDWATAKTKKSNCPGGGWINGAVADNGQDAMCVNDSKFAYSWCSANTDCNSNLCLNPGIAFKGGFCAPSGSITRKQRAENVARQAEAERQARERQAEAERQARERQAEADRQAAEVAAEAARYNQPDGTNVGWTNSRYCTSGIEQNGICTSLKPDGTNVGHLNGGLCQGGWAGDDDLCYSTNGTTGSGDVDAHVGNGRDRYCKSGRARMGGYCN